MDVLAVLLRIGFIVGLAWWIFYEPKSLAQTMMEFIPTNKEIINSPEWKRQVKVMREFDERRKKIEG